VPAIIVLPKPIMPYSKFLFLATIFPKNVGEGGGERFPKNFQELNKGSKIFSGNKPVKLKNFLYKFPLNHG
jgi:hypothetical protein